MPESQYPTFGDLNPKGAAPKWLPSLLRCNAFVPSSYLRSVILTEERFLRFQLGQDSNHAAVLEFFGGILSAQTPSNSLAKRELARKCMEPPGVPPKLAASQERLY